MDSIKALACAASSSLLAALMGACSLFGPSPGRQSLSLVLPAIPAAWASLPELRMALSWRGPGGRPRSALACPGSRLDIEVDRGLPQAILALPSSAGRGLRPAGAIYPQAAGDELVLDWKGGYAASLALALGRAGVDPWGFDLGRIAEEALVRCGDPWLVAPLESARALAEGDFRIDRFREPQRFPVLLPGPGPWAPESPLAPLPGQPALLPRGLWRFLGPEEELLVSVDGEGASLVLRRRPEGP